MVSLPPHKKGVIVCFEMNSEKFRHIIHMHGQNSSFGEVVEKLELSSIDGRNVKWCNHFGNHFVNSSKY